jgi:hypothetical protein
MLMTGDEPLAIQLELGGGEHGIDTFDERHGTLGGSVLSLSPPCV